MSFRVLMAVMLAMVLLLPTSAAFAGGETDATIRIVIPTAIIRLAAGREQLSDEEQGLCFLAGSNSIFSGEKLLTTPLPGAQKDGELLKLFSLKPRTPFKKAV